MSVEVYSPKRNRVYARKFDHDEARTRYAAGEAAKALAAEYGVSVNRIYQVVNLELGARVAAYAAQRQRSGRCERCGGQCSLYSPHCRACDGLAKTTTVREGELRCGSCGEWKPDSAFPRHSRLAHRRYRHRWCTACGTKAKRDYRRRTGRG